MSKLNWFSETNNAAAFPIKDGAILDNLTIGGNLTQVFKIPVNFDKTIKLAEITYYQGLKTVLTKQILSADIQQTDFYSYIYVYLSADETALFENTLLDASCQIRFVTVDDRIIYSAKYKFDVEKPLE